MVGEDFRTFMGSFPRTAHPMSVMASAVNALATFYPDTTDINDSDQLDEAATIDGASRFRVFFNIYLPLSVPILIFIMIGVFNGTWNDFMGPLMYLRKPETYTLALGVFMKYAGRLSEDSFPNVQMATGVLMIIPSAVIFFIFQKQLIDGVAIGGVKG